MEANTVVKFYRDLHGFLTVSQNVGVVEQVGDVINVGERFTLRVTVTNTAPAQHHDGPPWTYPVYPEVVFKHLALRVRPTEFATLVPVNAARLIGDIHPDWHIWDTGTGIFGRRPRGAHSEDGIVLRPGDSHSWDVEMEAVRAIVGDYECRRGPYGLGGCFSIESVATVRVEAALDLPSFFHFYSDWKTYPLQIEPD